MEAETASSKTIFPSEERKKAYDAAAALYTPISFGLDGGTDPQPQSKEDKPMTAQETHPDFDFRGVTLADYETKREDPNNAWHKGEVEDFFRELSVKERQQIQDYQRSSGKA